MLQFRAEASLLGRRMSKLQPAPEVLRSIDARRGSSERARSSTALARLTSLVIVGALTGCLGSGSGDSATTNLVLSSGTGVDAGTSGDTTLAPIMTTTEQPETTYASSSSSDSDASTTGVPVGCGDGQLQEVSEECDYGNDNADDGECTSECKKATCGDGKVHVGVEVCDDATNDGSYGGCAPDCLALGPRCGDGEIQAPEACDEADPKDGCLIETCQFAQSCRQIRDAFINDELDNGVYTIKPADKDPVQVLCDMDADGGGYTFLKIALPDPITANAKEAEAKCDEYGMDLLVPRTPMHVVASTLAAKSDLLAPLGGGGIEGSVEYLSIFGIYPVTPGQSCVGKAVNSVACPEWEAKNGTFWVTTKVFAGQPGTNNCEGCSMRYYWTNDGLLTDIEAINGGGNGAESALFMCDTGDKQAPV